VVPRSRQCSASSVALHSHHAGTALPRQEQCSAATVALRCFLKEGAVPSEPDSIVRKEAFSLQKYANMAEKRPFPFHFNSKKRRFSVFIGIAEVFLLVVFPASPEEK
jgi:hypothetical protein